jgi:hypothetical protein
MRSVFETRVAGFADTAAVEDGETEVTRETIPADLSRRHPPAVSRSGHDHTPGFLRPRPSRCSPQLVSGESPGCASGAMSGRLPLLPRGPNR